MPRIYISLVKLTLDPYPRYCSGDEYESLQNLTLPLVEFLLTILTTPGSIIL